MKYKFIWGDGKFDYAPAVASSSHSYLMLRTFGDDWDLNSLAMGYFDNDGQNIVFTEKINFPMTEDEFRFIIRQELERYDRRASVSLPNVIAATVEDTEPEYNFSFLTEPHSTLYPCAFEDNKMRPEALKTIKNYVLNAIGDGADQYIYFTVFGSGASYNWDEQGDFDVQMWVDIDKYNENHKNLPLTSDELLDMVRRAVQTVNFPSFKQLNLATEDCDGDMLIQYYPKPGKGTPEENLASKPYACYDMETDDWLQRPEKITPEFYGEHFLVVQTKAHDIAEQAELLLSQFQRNILSWQFWTQLESKYRNEEYLAAAEDAKTNAIIEQQGIATLFEGVFGGRKEAYSPEGQGIRDERDLVQKMLEVWGIFQKLKHFARAPLPWDEQEMPEEPKKESMWKEGENRDEALGRLRSRGLPPSGTFGYVDGNIIIGDSHHQAIIATLLNNGWTWEQLFNAPQAWGWWHVAGGVYDDVYISVDFSSDSGFQNDVDGAIKAISEFFELPIRNEGWAQDGADPDAYGQGLQGKERLEYYRNEGEQEALETVYGPIPKPKKIAKNVLEMPKGDTFGYVNGHLVIGNTHHQGIIANFLNNGWTWEDLFTVPQMWGWWQRFGEHIKLKFTSDSGFQNAELIPEVVEAFENLFEGATVQAPGYTRGVENEEEYGEGLSGKKWLETYLEGGKNYERIQQRVYHELTPIPDPPSSVHWYEKYFGEEAEGPQPLKGGPVPDWYKEMFENPKGPQPLKGETPEWFKEMFGQQGGRVPEGCTGTAVIFDVAGNWWIYHGKWKEGADLLNFKNSDALPYFESCPVHGYNQWSYHIDNPKWAGFAIGKWSKVSSMQKFADWNDIMEKAQRLRENGQVNIVLNAPDHVAGEVEGDHGTYDTEIWRDDPESQAITMWDCGCQWSDYSWGRTRQWKKYEGRPCSHALALFWEAQSSPVDEDVEPTVVPQPTPGGGMQEPMDVTPMMQPFDPSDLVAPFGRPATDGTPIPVTGEPAPFDPMQMPAEPPTPVIPAAPTQSVPTTPQNARTPLDIPGALSKVAAFTNGQIVRNRVPLYGEEPKSGTPHIIPQNSSGEVLYSDDRDTVVIFPLKSGELGPHLVKVECDTSELYADPKAQPFIWKKHHGARDNLDPAEAIEPVKEMAREAIPKLLAQKETSVWREAP